MPRPAWRPPIRRGCSTRVRGGAPSRNGTPRPRAAAAASGGLDHRTGRAGRRAAAESRALGSATPSLPPPDGYHFCTVPSSGQDAILFVGLAVVLACVLRGKLGSTLLLLAGAALQGLASAPGVTLGRLGNSISWFLSIVPVRRGGASGR